MAKLYPVDLSALHGKSRRYVSGSGRHQAQVAQLGTATSRAGHSQGFLFAGLAAKLLVIVISLGGGSFPGCWTRSLAIYMLLGRERSKKDSSVLESFFIGVGDLYHGAVIAFVRIR